MKFQLFIIRLGKLLEILRNPHLLISLVRHKVLAGVEHQQVFHIDFATIIDIGANCGQFSLAARRWSENANIIAFEPLPEPAGRFRKVFKGDSKVTLYKAAIGLEACEATIHVSGQEDSSSLLPIGILQQQLFPGTGEVRTETVRVGRLSSFVSCDEIMNPAMLKLDVQGFELQALQGCEELLGRFSHVYVECSFVELYSGQALVHEVISWLRERGFGLVGIYNIYYDRNGQSVQGDFLFKKYN